MGLAQKYDRLKARTELLEQQIDQLLALINATNLDLDTERAATIAAKVVAKRLLREAARSSNGQTPEARRRRRQMWQDAVALEEQTFRQFAKESHSYIVRLVEEVSNTHGVGFIVPTRPDRDLQ